MPINKTRPRDSEVSVSLNISCFSEALKYIQMQSEEGGELNNGIKRGNLTSTVKPFNIWFSRKVVKTQLHICPCS